MDGLPLRIVEGARMIIIKEHWEILPKIQMNGAGSSGIVATGLVGGFLTLIAFRLVDGAHFGDMRGLYGVAVPHGIKTNTAGSASARPSFSGRIILFYSPLQFSHVFFSKSIHRNVYS
jgi:hypothetical protein